MRIKLLKIFKKQLVYTFSWIPFRAVVTGKHEMYKQQATCIKLMAVLYGIMQTLSELHAWLRVLVTCKLINIEHRLKTQWNDGNQSQNELFTFYGTPNSSTTSEISVWFSSICRSVVMYRIKCNLNLNTHTKSMFNRLLLQFKHVCIQMCKMWKFPRRMHKNTNRTNNVEQRTIEID